MVRREVFKGKLGVIPEIAGYAVGATIGIFLFRRLLKTDAADQIARIPVAGSLLVAGPRAVMDEAFNG